MGKKGDEIGEVQLEPRTRVGLVDPGDRRHRLSLSRGVMHATIWAPPGDFVVDTPSAVAVDMGCRYTLEVDETGAGLLRVEAGWVGFEHRGLQSLVPAGAMCATRTGVGPGTPSFETASPEFAQALEAIDFGPAGEPRRAALERVLAGARAARRALALAPAGARLRRGPRPRIRPAERARPRPRGRHPRGRAARRARHARAVVGRARPRHVGVLADVDRRLERLRAARRVPRRHAETSAWLAGLTGEWGGVSWESEPG